MALLLRALLGLATVLWLLAAPANASAQRAQDVPLTEVQRRVQAASPAHPRLLLTPAKLDDLKQRVRVEPEARELLEALRQQAEGMLAVPPVEHIVTGRRLLTESQKALRRVLTLALVYRLDGDRRFLERARREMLAAAAFPGWNPSHFLDTAEMSLALALGYDWLFDDLSGADRAMIRQALLQKGIQASFENDFWVRINSNWGQVCHAGITAAALALLETHPDVAARVAHRAVNNVTYSMRPSFSPNGTYPEGPAYWEYGTSFNVILIDELETALGTDFGLSEMPGFSETASYINHATGPTGLFFHYADGSPTRRPLPALQWFAGRYDRPDWLRFEEPILKSYLATSRRVGVAGGEARLLPLALVWSPKRSRQGETRMGLHWLGKGEVPAAMHRTSWTDPNAIFVGIKAGSPTASHGQMDTGSFVLDADGVRWAVDLGAEDYHRIESRGMNLWTGDELQTADRWRVFRNNNRSHSTLVIGGQLQRAVGKGVIIKHSQDDPFPHTVVDLTSTYTPAATRVVRGIGLLDGSEVLVQDRIEGVQGQPVRWGMVTRAAVELRGALEAVLRQDGKQLTLRVVRPAGARLQLFDIATAPAEHDSPNPGVQMIGFEVQPAAGEALDFVVVLTPGSAARAAADALRVQPLSEW
ncbi:MAG: heparinase II/III family protein [Gemmatimonadetes bacterium]|nr:heparinase II/III family protein [Gemmatimonadota bacterium]